MLSFPGQLNNVKVLTLRKPKAIPTEKVVGPMQPTPSYATALKAAAKACETAKTATWQECDKKA